MSGLLDVTSSDSSLVALDGRGKDETDATVGENCGPCAFVIISGMSGTSVDDGLILFLGNPLGPASSFCFSLLLPVNVPVAGTLPTTFLLPRGSVTNSSSSSSLTSFFPAFIF